MESIIPRQHFLFTYSNTSTYTGPSEKMRDSFKNDLIFDKSRRSIFTQEQEFGYICNTKQSVIVRNGDGTTSTELTLNVQDGVITFSQYVPLQLSNFKVSLTKANGVPFNGTSVEMGTTVYTNSFSVNITGTNTSTTYNGFSQTGATNHSWEVIINKYMDLPDSLNYTCPSNVYFTENQQKTVTFKFFAQDDKTGDIAYVSANLYFYNHIRLLQLEDDTYNDFYKLYDELNKNEFRNISYSIKYDTLSGNYTINNFNCNNGPRQFLCLHLPKRICDKESIEGILGGASVQEFKKIPTYFSYQNSTNFSENYNIYLATGENWKGSSLTIK